MDTSSAQQLELTVNEAAYALGEPVKTVVRLVDEHPDLVRKTTVGKRTRRVLGRKDLAYMQAVGRLRDSLTPLGRRQLHEAFVASDKQKEVTFGGLPLSLEGLEKEVQERIDALDRLKDSIEGDPQDPFIRGSDVEVYRISALLAGGASLEEVQEDYPALRLEQIENARIYAQAIPKMGHPYPGRSFKRATQALDLHWTDFAHRGVTVIDPSKSPAEVIEPDPDAVRPRQ